MKKFLTLFALLFALAAIAQDAPAPVKVSKSSMNKFKSLYPAATNVDWSVDEMGRYVAHFTDNNKNRWITIDEKNGWTNSLFEIDKTDLPARAISQIDQWYDSGTFDTFYKFIDETGTIHYEADRESGDMVSGPIFDENGEATNKVARPKGERPTRIQ